MVREYSTRELVINLGHDSLFCPSLITQHVADALLLQK